MVRRGFSRVELVMLIGLVLVASAVIMVLWRPGRRAHTMPRIKEGESLRVIAQAMQAWTNASGDRWPLGSNWSGGTTANVYWTLLTEQLVAPEILVSPAEMNPMVRPFQAGGTFTVDLSTHHASHASFAHMQPSEQRVHAFLSGSSTVPLLSTRFPEVKAVSAWHSAIVTTPFVNEKSLAISHDWWIGNVAYADGHVRTESTWLNKGVTDTWGMPTYTDDAGAAHPDLPFLDEPDDPSGTNQFLGIFTKAGRERGDFKAAYD